MYTLIFCQPEDAFASDLYRELFDRGLREIRIITAPECCFARWLHQCNSDGRYFTRISLQDGFVVEPAMIGRVINRITYFQMPHFIDPVNRGYAETEMMALYSSFLFSIAGRVVDGMPVEHINRSAENSLLFCRIAINAGLSVLDNSFSSSPRWQQPKNQTAWGTSKKENAAFVRKSPHLVWENKPALYYAAFDKLEKWEVIGGRLLQPNSIDKKSRDAIKKFSSLAGLSVFVLYGVRNKNDILFYNVDDKPKILSDAATAAFADWLKATELKE